MQWIARLSRVQKLWLVASLLAAALIVVAGVATQEESADESTVAFTTEMSLREMAPPLRVTGGALARELGLPLDAPKGEPVGELGITQPQLDHATHHILSHEGGTLKYYVFVALALFGLVYLVRLGRPDGCPVAERKTWYPRWPYVVALVAAVVVCGFALGKSPNPMEAAVKVFKSMVGLYPSVADKVLGLAFFAVLAIIGNKIICGWACPFGALQELIYHVPVLRRIKRRRLPFAVSNTIRITLFVVMLLFLFGIVGGRKGFVVYHYINPFNLFNLDIETVWVGGAIAAALVLAFGLYRPFCQLVCPFGLLSWLLERFSLFRIRIDRARCTGCGACERACPLDAAGDRVAGKALPADCFSCARCLRVCPEDAITYGLVGRTRASAEADAARND